MSPKVALCTGIKGEGHLLREFVEYYISIGINRIFLYDNNDPDGEKPSELLKGLEDYVDITDIRGNQSKTRQWDSYTDCYNKHNYEFDFICFFDSDEFLFLNKDKTIQEYLSRPMFQNVDCICPNWKMYTDNDLIYPIPNKSTFEQFQNPLSYEHLAGNFHGIRMDDHIKTIVHCRNKLIIFKHPHYPISSEPLVCVNASGVHVPSHHPFSHYDFEYAELRHYQLRTTSEFCHRRLWGRGKQMFDGMPYIPAKEIAYYFSYNKFTPEKWNYIQKYCKENNIQL